jgi:hypothetical protein
MEESSPMNRQRGCLEGLLEMFFLTAIFDWLQDRFGFGRGVSCSGGCCGCLLTIIFVFLMCGIITGTNWLSLLGGR